MTLPRQRARRPLPDDDPVIEGLPPERRALLAEFWASRAHAELRAATDFAHLSSAAFRLNAPLQVLQLASRAVNDEVYHAQLCHEVACRYAGQPLAFPEVEVADRAAFDGADEELTDLLHVVMTSCVVESIAVAYMQTCLGMAEAPLARAALREILADEIDHARIGWALLASERVTPALKAEVALGLRPLLRGCVASWCQDDKPPGDDPAHGFPSRATVRAIVADAVGQVVVPGFALVGVDTGRARKFVADELPGLCAAPRGADREP